MKVCTHCNSNLEDTASFCPYCGQRLSEEAKNKAHQEALYTLRRNLRHERKCWSIFGWVYLGISIALAVIFFLIFGVVGMVTETFELLFVGILYGFIYLAILLPIAIINLVMASKTKKYIDTVDADCGPAVERCGNVGMIVLGAFLNTIALIFIILNFVHVKTNRAVLNELAEEQQN